MSPIPDFSVDSPSQVFSVVRCLCILSGTSICCMKLYCYTYVCSTCMHINFVRAWYSDLMVSAQAWCYHVEGMFMNYSNHWGFAVNWTIHVGICEPEPSEIQLSMPRRFRVMFSYTSMAAQPRMIVVVFRVLHFFCSLLRVMKVNLHTL